MEHNVPLFTSVGVLVLLHMISGLKQAPTMSHRPPYHAFLNLLGEIMYSGLLAINCTGAILMDHNQLCW